MKSKKNHPIGGFIWLALALVLWWAVTTYGGYSRLLLPSPQLVVEALYKGIAKGNLILMLGQSVLWVLLGTLLATLLAVGMAIVSYSSPFIKQPLQMLSGALHPLPAIALLPILVLWFGVGRHAVFAAVFHAVIWSSYILILSGLDQQPREISEEAAMEGCTAFKTAIYILLPMSFTSVTTAVKVGWSRGWRAVISAEMLFGAVSQSGGIGWFLYERRAFMDTPGVFAGVIAVAVTGMIAEGLANRLVDKL